MSARLLLILALIVVLVPACEKPMSTVDYLEFARSSDKRISDLPPPPDDIRILLIKAAGEELDFAALERMSDAVRDEEKRLQAIPVHGRAAHCKGLRRAKYRITQRIYHELLSLEHYSILPTHMQKKTKEEKGIYLSEQGLNTLESLSNPPEWVRDALNKVTDLNLRLDLVNKAVAEAEERLQSDS